MSNLLMSCCGMISVYAVQAKYTLTYGGKKELNIIT